MSDINDGVDPIVAALLGKGAPERVRDLSKSIIAVAILSKADHREFLAALALATGSYIHSYVKPKMREECAQIHGDQVMQVVRYRGA